MSSDSAAGAASGVHLGDEGDKDEGNLMVALYDFDPSTINWPFKREKPLPIMVGQVIKVILDDGSEWALGHYHKQEESRGYFPKNYTVSLAEYHEMMEDYANSGDAMEQQGDEEEDEEVVRGPPEARAIPEGPLPEKFDKPIDPMIPMDSPLDEPEIAYPGVVDYPVLEPQPPLATTYELTKGKLLREMPAVPQQAMEEPSTPTDSIVAAREEVERELRASQDPNTIVGGKLTESRSSTPATKTMTRPERDFVRKHISMEWQDQYLTPLSSLSDLVRKRVRAPYEEKTPYNMDLRVRHTTCRIARGIEVPDMRRALRLSAKSGARWTQMFRPGFNDIVNESFRVGCNACILSDAYLTQASEREQFQKWHAKDVNGTLWFELQRKKDHLFYMRMDMVDVMMCHPKAWNFPDTDRIVSANPGEPINPFHGWYAQVSIDTDKEMHDVDFLYTLRLRVFPETTFQALALGKIPEWIQPYMSLHAEAEAEEDGDDDDEDAAVPHGHGKAVPTDGNLLLEAGLEDSDNIYVKLDEVRLARERTVGADVLDTKTMSFKLQGLSAMRIFLRSRGQPDNMKQAQISPKMVKDMAAQLGIRHDASHYWYCMFALRYPLNHDWEAVVKNDTRLYLHLPTDRLQPIHPMIRRFREHLEDTCQNEFLWDYRQFVKMKCSECGLPDSVIWCQQCTDYFCAACFWSTHKSSRGKKHYPMPIPGCRYLTQPEAAKLAGHLPLLNVGFSNRRRFLARDNQSDKMGSRSGDPWLFFDADTFQAALAQTPENNWYVKRLLPPRLGPDAEGYYYNFAHDIITDDASHILTKTHEQRALSLLQKCIRGAITRRKIKKEVKAALVIQNAKRMWDCQRIHGNNGRNAAILKSWYRKWKAREDRLKLEARMAKLQAIYAGYEMRKFFSAQMRTCRRFQSAFRGLIGRRRAKVLKTAAITIQRFYRGRLFGRLPMREKHENAAKIQAMARGVAFRENRRLRIRSATYIAAHIRGCLARNKIRRMRLGVQSIQNNWRRFQAQLDVKVILYERLESVRQKRAEILQAKLEDKVASLLQRNFRRHRDYQKFVFMRREKGEADKRTSTMLVALWAAASSIRHYVHPWWRHLPTEIQEVLVRIKASMQRTIGLVPLTGKLANEELGRRGLRVSSDKHLHYDQTGKDPDLASHMFLSVTRHLLSHVPAELFAPTVKWACYSVGHQAVAMNTSKSGKAGQMDWFPRDDIQVGKDFSPHPGDSLATMWKDLGIIKHHHDWLLTLPEESLPCLFLNKLPPHHRHVFLTAEVLVLMRQALDSPQISTDDHLKFQGLDTSAGAQLMEVIGSEMQHKLPLDLPKNYGTVAALAGQLSTIMQELQPERKKGESAKEAKEGVTKAKSKAKAKAKSESGSDKVSAKSKAKAAAKLAAKLLAGKEPPTSVEPPESGLLSHFNRAATLRIMQQVGYFMRDQDKLIDAVLARSGDTGRKGPGGVRQSQHISVTDKLFDMADRAKHDHCSFVLAVVLYHMVLRGLVLRVLYHRAAIALQKRYRYLKNKGKKANMVGPAITIQRFWRGLKASLLVMRRDDAAFKIQQSYKAWCWNRRAAKLLRSTLTAQRIWLGAIHRRWLRECHGAATFIQKFARGLQVRSVLDKQGRELTRQYRTRFAELMKQKSSMGEALYLAKISTLAGRMRKEMHDLRFRNIDNKRMATTFTTLRSRHTRASDKEKKLRMRGAIQPVRISVFEPMVCALARLEPPAGARYGSKTSRVLVQAMAARQKLDRTMPKAVTFEPHVTARRGRAAILARRLAKRPKEVRQISETKGPVDINMLNKWAARQFFVK
eukprot:TRINITY_DN29173_c0_g1_i1.p1 TRINITY_DN29173_c0_g1~~TRINITY_DN29173_c0_g1_i1.p1  ORF type:complete len:1809 (-),score=307.62 TRINITY_DN29173_c0_g1_i1:171-5597(-)